MKEVDKLLRYNYAPLWKRIFAYIIDISLVNLIVIVPFKTIIAKPENSKQILLIPSIDLIIAILTIILLILIYFIYTEYKVKQTLGKLLFNLKVMPDNADLKQIITRNITKPFSILLILDTLYMVKTQNLRYTEVISKTWVSSK